MRPIHRLGVQSVSYCPSMLRRVEHIIFKIDPVNLACRSVIRPWLLIPFLGTPEYNNTVAAMSRLQEADR